MEFQGENGFLLYDKYGYTLEQYLAPIRTFWNSFLIRTIHPEGLPYAQGYRKWYFYINSVFLKYDQYDQTLEQECVPSGSWYFPFLLTITIDARTEVEDCMVEAERDSYLAKIDII